jgi:hypothetical protein
VRNTLMLQMLMEDLFLVQLHLSGLACHCPDLNQFHWSMYLVLSLQMPSNILICLEFHK